MSLGETLPKSVPKALAEALAESPAKIWGEPPSYDGVIAGES